MAPRTAPVLAGVRPGTSVLVTDVDVPPATRRRLAELGVRPGVRVTVVSRSAGGGRVVAAGHARIALDRVTVAHLAVADPATPAGPLADAPGGRRPRRAVASFAS